MRHMDMTVITGIVIFALVLRGPLEGVFGIMPRQIVWGMDAFIALFCAKNIFDASRKDTFRPTPVFLPILAFFAWSFFSGLVNGIDVMTMVVAFKDYSRYIFLYYAIIHSSLSENDLKKLIYLFLVIVVLQVPITVIQYFIYGVGDPVCGTLGLNGTGEMLLLIAAAIGIFIGFLLYQKKNKARYMCIMPFFILPLVFGSVRAAIFFIPANLIFILRKLSFFKFANTVAMTVSFLAVTSAALYFIPPVKQEIIRLWEGMQDGLQRQEFSDEVEMRASRPGRFTAVSLTFDWLKEKYQGYMFGYGFGVTKESYYAEYGGEYALDYSPKGTQLAVVLLESGIPALCIYLRLIWVMLVWNIKVFKVTQDPFWKAVAFGADGIIFMYIAGVLYLPVWSVYYATLPFWFFCAIIYKMDLLRLKEQKGL